MTTNREIETKGAVGAGCHIRVWSPDCKSGETTDPGEKYLCSSCKSIPDLEHEIHHEQFPHLCGDEDNMS